MSRKLFTIILGLAIWLGGCNLPSAGDMGSARQDAVKAWFDAPLPGSIVHPPDPCQIVAHGASPNGIAAFELSINGAVSASIPSPDTQSSLVTLSRDCGISEPGEYLLQLRARDNAGKWSVFAQTSLVIAGDETAEIPATESPDEPTPTPTGAPGSVSIQQVSTNLVYLGSADCDPRQVVITAQAAAPNGIKVVVLFYRFQPGGASDEFKSLAMIPTSGDLYRVTLDPTALLGGAVPFDQATLQYQVVVQQNDGDTSLRTPVMTDVAVRACSSATTPTPPTPTPGPITPTKTPTMPVP
jgi:hypothetical protein